MPLLIETRPSYREVSQLLPVEDLLYVAPGHFARRLLQLQQQSRTQSFPAVARVVEWLHVEGDHYVREAAALGGHSVDPGRERGLLSGGKRSRLARFEQR